MTEALRSLRETGFYFQQRVAQDDCLSIAHSLGVPVGDNRNPEPVRLIRPQQLERAKPNTLSSRYGMNAFPFHTDAAYWLSPPRFILFHCVNPGAGNRPTLLIDPREWRLPDSDRRALYNGVWRVTTRRPFLCTVGTQADDGMRVRFDQACMVPVTSNAKDVCEAIREVIKSSRETSIRWSKGDLLIIDNLRLLHARGEGTQSDEDRILARILIRR